MFLPSTIADGLCADGEEHILRRRSDSCHASDKPPPKKKEKKKGQFLVKEQPDSFFGEDSRFFPSLFPATDNVEKAFVGVFDFLSLSIQESYRYPCMGFTAPESISQIMPPLSRERLLCLCVMMHYL